VSFAGLLVRTATVHRIAEQGADRYNSPTRVEIGATTYPAWVEQSRSSEELIDRNSVRTDALLILPAYAEIGPLDWVEIDGVAYEVDGTPARVWRGIAGREHHVEAALKAIKGK
jgi:hypothetical protein